jgi:hypothetical protein
LSSVAEIVFTACSAEAADSARFLPSTGSAVTCGEPPNPDPPAVTLGTNASAAFRL